MDNVGVHSKKTSLPFPAKEGEEKRWFWKYAILQCDLSNQLGAHKPELQENL